jgi:hypothetical protein
MTREAFLADRQRIVDALQRASIAEIRFHKDDIPKSFPCAVVVLETEDGLLFAECNSLQYPNIVDQILDTDSS